MTVALLQLVPARDAELPALVGPLRGRILGGVPSSSMENVLGRTIPRRGGDAPPALPTLRQLDKDGDGTLDLAEIVAATKGRLPESTLRQQLDRFDRDGDGRLDAEEFAEAVRTLARR
jgi:hypothetical protein